MNQFVEEHAVVHDILSGQLVILFEYSVTDRAAEQEHIAAGAHDDFGILAYHLAGLLAASGQHHRPATTQSAVGIHHSPRNPGLVQNRSCGLAYARGQMGHATGEVEHVRGAQLVQHRFGRKLGIVGVDAVFAHGSLRQTHLGSVNLNLAHRGALAAHQALVAYLLDALLVASPQLPV